MEMLKTIVILLVGFVLLIKGAGFFVDGSSTVAKKLRIPSIIVGLTIVAMGTSLPELAVSVTASLNGNNGIAISNVVGSNVFNLLVVCGVCALVSPLAIKKEVMKKDFPIAIGCGVLLLVMGIIGMEVGRVDGIVLCVLFVIYNGVLIKMALKSRNDSSEEENTGKLIPIWLCIIYIVGGIVAIKFGGDFVVDGAVVIAGKLGMSDNLIGLTIVAVGTSLPELVTSIVASKKNETEMAIGNALGSSIFNVLFILGVAGVISPMGFNMENVIDVVIVSVASIIVYIFGWTKGKVDRKEGIVMILLYASYLVYACIR